MWPVYLDFRGGKGVATMAGVLFAMNWMAGTAGLVVFVLVVLCFRYVSLASMIAAVAAPVAHLFTMDHVRKCMQPAWIILIYLILAAGLVAFRHRENVRRLLKGEEHKLGRKKT
jgi:glycerol-3-phosphate acyltransferase PlsY